MSILHPQVSDTLTLHYLRLSHDHFETNEQLSFSYLSNAGRYKCMLRTDGPGQRKALSRKMVTIVS